MSSIAFDSPNNLETKEGPFCFPCSLSQRACWFIDQIAPGTPTNNLAVRFALAGEVKPALLEEAFRAIIERHEILRTRFLSRNGEPVQLAEPEVPFSLDFVSLLDRDDHSRAAEAERLAAEEARGGFNLTQAPLFRARLIQRAEQDFILLITIHHIISDGWSIGLITNELGAIYAGLVEGHTPDVPALEIQYADFACWQSEQIEGGEMKPLLEAQRARFDGFVPLMIPTDFARPVVSSSRGEIRSLVLPRELTNRLQEVGAQQQATLFVTMFSAFLVLLQQESGQHDIVVRTQTAGRDRAEVEPLVGWFVNSILLRGNLVGDPAFTTLVARMRAEVLAAFEYKDIPFELLMETIRPDRKVLRHPPFQVNFIFQRDLVQPWQRGGISMTPLPSKAAGTFVDLNFFLVERSDGWRLSVDVDGDVFRSSTGDYFLEKFVAILEIVARNPQVGLSEIETRLTRDLGETAGATLIGGGALIAPRNAVERELVSIWEEVLKTTPISVDANFFDLGGHSLLAVQMLSRVQDRCGSRMSLAKLFREPTIEAMARALDSSAPSNEDGLIPVQPFGALPPLFLIGGDHFFRPLARHLGEDQPVLGVSLQQYESRSEPTPFEEIARDVADTLVKANPAGPYLLGGWCVDGAIAYEVARELRARKREVLMVVLLDAINPAYRRELESTKKSLERAVKRTLRLAKQTTMPGPEKRGAGLWAEVCDLGRRAAQALRPNERLIEQDPVIVQNDPSRQEFRRLLYISERNYTPQPIDVPLLLLRSELSPYQASDLGWAKLSSQGLETREMDGGHIGMFREPHVRSLAEAMSRRLARFRGAA